MAPDMAPALTDPTAQNRQPFNKLTPQNHHELVALPTNNNKQLPPTINDTLANNLTTIDVIPKPVINSIININNSRSGSADKGTNIDYCDIGGAMSNGPTATLDDTSSSIELAAKMGLKVDSLSTTLHNNKSNNGGSSAVDDQLSMIGDNVDDLMQVIKSIDQLNGPSTGSAASDFISDLNNLSNFEKQLLDDVDMMNMTMEEEDYATMRKETQAEDQLAELLKRHAKIERRLDFLRRRAYKLQIRHMGQHVGQEVAGVFEYVHRSIKNVKQTTGDGLVTDLASSAAEPEGPSKPISSTAAKSLAKKMEMSSQMQANSAARQRVSGAHYFGAGSSEPTALRNGNINGMVVVPSWPADDRMELQKVAGMLKSEMSVAQKEFDSEATESSSGGESCDEMQSYVNPHQQYLSIQKRSLWKYSTDRAAIAARWTWLQSQITDLEYRIRQHTELHKKIRSTKGAIQLGGVSPPPPHLVGTSVSSPPTTGAVNGYRGQLPGSSTSAPPKTPLLDDNSSSTAVNSSSSNNNNSSNNGGPTATIEYQCARTRPLLNFRKRKLLLIGGLHAVSKKAARPSSVRCNCAPPGMPPCALCTGRTDPTYPRDPPETMSRLERIAQLDPAFHPVFSLPEDISQKIHFDAIMKTTDWQQRSSRMKSLKVLSKMERLDKSPTDQTRGSGTKLKNKLNSTSSNTVNSTKQIKASTMSALSAKLKSKIRGRKSGRHSTSSTSSLARKRHSTGRMSNYHNLNQTEDEEVEAIGSNNGGTSRSLDSPNSSPLLQMQTISGYKKNHHRIHSYDIDNIVIPYSVAASTRVEKLQYKEILTPKWRIADPDFSTKYELKNNGMAVKEVDESVADGQEGNNSDTEDLSEEAMIARHERCEHEEKKRFLSYLKLPIGYGRSRSHKRTDSRAESSGANTPDPMSPHAVDTQNSTVDNNGSPITSPSATPQSVVVNEEQANPVVAPLPSVSAMIRRRTVSQSRHSIAGKDRNAASETTGGKGATDEGRCNSPETVEVAPYERRVFPLPDDIYEKMLKHMPDHQLKTNDYSQDSGVGLGGATTNSASGGEGTGATTAENNLAIENSTDYLDDNKLLNSPGSDTTESALGEEDPNDPEWMEMEQASRDRHKR